MSKATQNKFIDFINQAQIKLSAEFNISNRNTKIDEYVTRISFNFGKGIVEFLCGPPEYHAEIFISVQDERSKLNRYDLARLMSIPHLRNWVVKNKPNINHGDKIRAEIDWFILLLIELRKLPEFKSLE